MKKILTLIVAMIPGLVFADSGADSIDEFIDAAGESGARWRTLFLAECLDATNKEVQAMFYAERKLGDIPPFSVQWCIKNHHVPGDGSKNRGA